MTTSVLSCVNCFLSGRSKFLKFIVPSCVCVWGGGGGGARNGLGCLTLGSFHCLYLDLFTTNKAWLVTSTSLLGGWS